MKRTPCPSGDIRVQGGMTCRNDAQSPARCRRRGVHSGRDRQSSRAGCPARSAAARHHRRSAHVRCRPASPPSFRLASHKRTCSSTRPWKPRRCARGVQSSAVTWGRRSRQTASRRRGESDASSASGASRTPCSARRTAYSGRSAGPRTRPGTPPTATSASCPCDAAPDGCVRSRAGRSLLARSVCREAAARVRLHPYRRRLSSPTRRHRLVRCTL